jgi:hypothetical protein
VSTQPLYEAMYSLCNGGLLHACTLVRVHACTLVRVPQTKNNFNTVDPDLLNNLSQKVLYFSNRRSLYRCSPSASALLDAEGEVLKWTSGFSGKVSTSGLMIMRVASVVVSNSVGFIAFSNVQ